MYFVYVLQSIKDNRYYVGYTKSLETRLKCHNSGSVRSTKSRIPWELIYKEGCQTKREARIRELQIKKYKSGEAFKKLIGSQKSWVGTEVVKRG